ncbi:MAG: hypothetical protein D6806_13390 [Deltaproteobacteria bacterium]|nr:MAG: hypothetical protein D6806_13390 [Deltaproteobacteria bacterium]
MRRFVTLQVIAFAVALLPALRTEAGASAPIVAVFDMEDRGSGLKPEVLENLTEYLSVLLAERGYKVIPRDQIKQRLVEQKKESYKSCYDQSCQIELGRELAAQKALATRVIKIADTCQVAATLFDLKKAATDRAASAEAECTEKSLLQAVRKIAEKLAIVPVEEKPQVQSGIVQAGAGREKPVKTKTKKAEPAEQKSKPRIYDFTFFLGVEAGAMTPSSGSDWTVRIALDISDQPNQPSQHYNLGAGGRLEAYFDWRFSSRFTLGGVLSFFNAKTSQTGDSTFTDQIGVVGVCAQVRYLGVLNDRMVLRPSVFVGFGSAVTGKDYETRLANNTPVNFDLNGTMGLIAGFSLDFVWYVWDSVALLANVGAIASPHMEKMVKLDSNSQAMMIMSFPPMIFLSLGAEFGL